MSKRKSTNEFNKAAYELHRLASIAKTDAHSSDNNQWWKIIDKVNELLIVIEDGRE